MLRQADSKSDLSLKASIEDNLGAALTNVGEFGFATYLDEAVTVFRAALREPGSLRDPVFSAVVQTNMGVALHELGVARNDKALLHRAAAEYRSALSALDPQCQPSKWVYAQYNLAAALFLLGDEDHSTAEVEDSIIASRAALSLPEGNTALSSAAAKVKIAQAEWVLGKWNSDAHLLDESISDFRSALPALRAGPIHDWAAEENSLGNALLALANLDPGSRDLYSREAIKAYETPLTDTLKAKDPTMWAEIDDSAGSALQTLGNEEGQTADLTEAISAYGQAEVVWKNRNRTKEAAADELATGVSFTDLYRITGKVSDLTASVTEFRTALKSIEPRRDAYLFGAAQLDLANSLYSQGMNQHSGTILFEASVTYDAAATAFAGARMHDASAHARSLMQQAYSASQQYSK